MFDVKVPGVGRVGDIRPITIVGLQIPDHTLVHASTDTISNREVQEASDNFMPGQAAFWGQFDQKGWVTAARDQLTDVDAYHASPGYLTHRRLANCDDYIWSMHLSMCLKELRCLGSIALMCQAVRGTRGDSPQAPAR